MKHFFTVNFDLHQKRLTFVMNTLLKDTNTETELQTTRRMNLLFLLAESGDKKKEMALKTGIGATQISMFTSDSPSSRKPINNTQARKIEEAYGKPVLWLDQDRRKPQAVQDRDSNDDDLEEIIGNVFHAVKIARAEIKSKSAEKELSKEEKKKILLASIHGNVSGRITEEQFSDIISMLL